MATSAGMVGLDVVQREFGRKGSPWKDAPALPSRAMADTEGTIHLERFTNDARQIVAGAQALADDRKHAEVSPLHLLVRLLERDRGVLEVFRRAGADPNETMNLAEAALRRQPKSTGGVSYVDARLLDLLGRAEREATR